MKSCKAFTLIELLVVVAVIAILAAIAVPNLLAAQTRARTSRVLSDMRAQRAAIEAYAVDHRVYPRMTWGSPPYNDLYEGKGSPLQAIYGTLGPWITTPIAYIHEFDTLDPFSDERIQADARMYTYHDLKTKLYVFEANPGDPGAGWDLPIMERNFGAYFQLSIGPDKGLGLSGPGPREDFYMQYDPTNGTISDGNIIVSQKDPGLVAVVIPD